MVGISTTTTMTSAIALSSIAGSSGSAATSSSAGSRIGFVAVASTRRRHPPPPLSPPPVYARDDDRSMLLLPRLGPPLIGRIRYRYWGTAYRSSSIRVDLYRKFHDYAWDALTSSSSSSSTSSSVDEDEHDVIVDSSTSSRWGGTAAAAALDDDDDDVPERLRSNSSPVKNAPPGTSVVASVRSLSRFPFLGGGCAVAVPSSSSSAAAAAATTATEEDDGTTGGMDGGGEDDGCRRQALRLSRMAFLETRAPTGEALITNMTIHVLNFVSFPDPRIRRMTRDDDGRNDDGGGYYLGLPIFGADIVSLPGNKHLVALDFQPVLPLEDDDDDGEGRKSPLFPERYSRFEDKLRALHSKYQGTPDDPTPPLLPWGGDIPQKARRFFSPHALWTRLDDADAMDIVNTVVWEAFKDYTDLYLELMSAVQDDLDSGMLEVAPTPTDRGVDIDNPVWRGQMDYLEYRRTNDPARPMLRRLYGNEWSESVIGEVLFPDL
ncbi:hypothetical protein ACHAXA_002341 [Cyclostephanos tholiformis]|uniref:Phycoerythrobilin:ferredoxin oxidoreductase n=1 Tax=Cyclostephanos tholiformis TaxID=382380 RepID=A0ABD3SR75_9STRA